MLFLRANERADYRIKDVWRVGEMVRSTPNKDKGEDHNFKLLSGGV